MSVQATSDSPADADHWRQRAHDLEQQLNQLVIGMPETVRMMLIAVFARGHVLLEGDVGVGKTTLLRAMAMMIGGAYSRVEGTIDLMPSDLVYHTYIDDQGKPKVEPGPLLQHGEQLSVFFFNEINRARPQVHSLMLRVMAEKSLQAFQQTYQFPHLQVFADRNRLERDETYALPPAARDRFMLEIQVNMPADETLQKQLMFDQVFHDTDTLLSAINDPILDYQTLNTLAAQIQQSVSASDALQTYALRLWQACNAPHSAGVELSDIDVSRLMLSGASPRGMGMLIRAAKVVAWLNQRDYLLPEDIRDVFPQCIAHRLFFTPIYEQRRDSIMPVLIKQLLQRVPI